MNDDGTVDFHSLENVNHVKQGDVVAVLHPEDMGDAGTDILERMSILKGLSILYSDLDVIFLYQRMEDSLYRR